MLFTDNQIVIIQVFNELCNVLCEIFLQYQKLPVWVAGDINYPDSDLSNQTVNVHNYLLHL